MLIRRHRGEASATVTRLVTARDRIVVRWAAGSDGDALVDLAGLADAPLPDGPLLLVEADGALVAAVSATTGAAVADPFRPTDDLVALARLRVRQLGAA